MKMKIVVVVPYLKSFGGASRYAWELSEYLATQGDDVIKENIQGVIHIVGKKKVSMFKLAQLTTPDIKPMTLEDYSGPNLTVDMSLDSEVWEKYDIKENGDSK